jgi:hypothetical protein
MPYIIPNFSHFLPITAGKRESGFYRLVKMRSAKAKIAELGLASSYIIPFSHEI